MSDESAETPVLDLMGTMTAASMEASRLDPQSLMLVRIAALVAVNAPPSSYLLNLGAAGEVVGDPAHVGDVLIAPFGHRAAADAGADADEHVVGG